MANTISHTQMSSRPGMTTPSFVRQFSGDCVDWMSPQPQQSPSAPDPPHHLSPSLDEGRDPKKQKRTMGTINDPP